MIEAIRGWIISVAAAAFLVSLSQSLIPEGTVRKIAGFAGGLVLLLVMLKPFPGVDVSGLELGYEDYAMEIQQRQTELKEQSNQTMGELIAEKTEAYILDKAAALGISWKGRHSHSHRRGADRGEIGRAGGLYGAGAGNSKGEAGLS